VSQEDFLGLRFDPAGGGQFKQAVQQLIEIENQPIKTMQGHKAKEEARMKLFQEFKSKFSGLDKALNEMTTLKKFREIKTDLGEGANLAGVTVDKDRVEVGQYQLEINQLAAKQSLISIGFKDPNEAIFGPGTIRIDTENDETIELSLGSSDSSLRGIASAINRNTQSPLRATVVKDMIDSAEPWKLILSSKKEGATNQLSIPEFNFESGPDLRIQDQHKAQNSIVTLNSFQIEEDSNDINDFLPGMNLHLKQALPDHPFTVTITEDYQKISAKLKNLVDQVNQILQFIIKQNTIDDKTDTTTTFAGDTGLQSLEYQIRNIMQQGFPTGNINEGVETTMQLYQIGIEFDKSGALSFKEDKFNKTIETGFSEISEAISGPLGLANLLKTTIDGYTASGTGMLSSREQGIRSRIKNIDEQIENKTRLVEQKKQQIIDQFSKLEGSVGNLQRQQQQLSATLGGGSGNSISQLLGG